MAFGGNMLKNNQYHGLIRFYSTFSLSQLNTLRAFKNRKLHRTAKL